jgi:NADH:ubiquinone oxidoreductase subunit 5 (subunit L)/multisubunit Na+/H+ antiporter MnhA subunit
MKNFISVMAFSTLLLGSFVALKRYDCKEIVAYSTLSQVGFMIFTLSLNLNNQAFFHLITHALFKSLLFICSGVIIHEFLTQDVRLISLKKIRPTIKIPMLISLLSIRGLPFLRGFYSKDYIIDSLAINLENLKL